MPDSSMRISPIAKAWLSKRKGDFATEGVQGDQLKRLAVNRMPMPNCPRCAQLFNSSNRIDCDGRRGGGRLGLGFDVQIGLVVHYVNLEVAEQQRLKDIVP